MSAPGGPGGGDDRGRGPLFRGLRHALARALFALDPAEVERLRERAGRLEERAEAAERRLDGAERRLDAAEARAREQTAEIEALRDARVPQLERRLDAAEAHARELVAEIEALRDARVPGLEGRLGEAERALSALTRDLAEVRDQRLPAAVARGDVLVERLARELEEVASLVERILLREPLPAAEVAPAEEDALDLARLAPHLLEALRGPEGEIRHRLEAYVPLLAGHAPVLDLGCGRGELLGLLAEAGIEATGVEADPALAAACRRRGLPVEEADVLVALADRADATVGAVTAVHLLEHLPTPLVARLLAEVRRVLRPGGVCVVEVPDPETLRVGGAEFWLDPTHVRPLPARTVEVLARAAGLSVRERRRLHPFPEEQRLAARIAPALAAVEERVAGAVRALAEALDELLNGPRDVMLVLERPEDGAEKGEEG